MWQRFTQRARTAIFYAQEEAQRFGEGFVSTEHILLGLLREGDSIAGRILTTIGEDPADLRKQIEKHLATAEGVRVVDMTLTPRAKRVIDLAYQEARDLGNDYIGTEHLLLGVIREADGLAGRVLKKRGVKLELVRTATIAMQTSEGRNGGEPVANLGMADAERIRVQGEIARSEARRISALADAAAFMLLHQDRFVADQLLLCLLASPDPEMVHALLAMKLDRLQLMSQIEVKLLAAASDGSTSITISLPALFESATASATKDGSNLRMIDLVHAILSDKNSLSATVIDSEEFKQAWKSI